MFEWLKSIFNKEEYIWECTFYRSEIIFTNTGKIISLYNLTTICRSQNEFDDILYTVFSILDNTTTNVPYKNIELSKEYAVSSSGTYHNIIAKPIKKSEYILKQQLMNIS